MKSLQFTLLDSLDCNKLEQQNQRQKQRQQQWLTSHFAEHCSIAQLVCIMRQARWWIRPIHRQSSSNKKWTLPLSLARPNCCCLYCCLFAVCTNWLCFAGLIERKRARENETKEGTNSVCETVVPIYHCQEGSPCGTQAHTHCAGCLVCRE